MCQIREYIGRDRMLGTFPYRPRKKRFRGNHCGFCFELPGEVGVSAKKEERRKKKEDESRGYLDPSMAQIASLSQTVSAFNNTVLGHLYGFIQHVIRHRSLLNPKKTWIRESIHPYYNATSHRSVEMHAAIAL
jgi:hypothetical protein